MNKTLYCAISYHGYGHIAQTIPVLNRLKELRPDIDIVIQSTAPRHLLEAGFDFPFEHVNIEADFGMVMKNALDVDVQASHQRYIMFHRQWSSRLEQVKESIAKVSPAIVLSNVSYLVNEAASLLSVPVVNMCSLNWLDIYRSYCGSYPDSSEIIDSIQGAYNKAELFLQLTPGMPMQDMAATKEIGTVARMGVNRSTWIKEKKGLEKNCRLILVSYGGLELPIDYLRWPEMENSVYLACHAEDVVRNDFISVEGMGISYIDIMASCDAVITKPGYGMFSEAACNGLPVMYTRRPGWPEERYLVEWLRLQANCMEVTREDLYAGKIARPLQELLAQAKKERVVPGGIELAAAKLISMIGR